ncbi:DinB family protein [Acinetobacter boissieri]|uniref:DinB family protein n=1 Tax=Acinetobacter boissieri TaxID=1219383 RepID=UPI000B8342D6|nr:DinB family protein [Acinetobacter boissieri]
MDIETLKHFSDYHIWATARLNETLMQVSEQDFIQDRGLFFNSILGTLNHMYVGETLWFARFNQLEPPRWQLNQMVLPNKMDLLLGLQEKTVQWQSFIETIPISILESDLRYRSSTGVEYCLPYGQTLLHVFNHATHHRGQITAALTQLGYICPELDWVYMLVELKQ